MTFAAKAGAADTIAASFDTDNGLAMSANTALALA